MVNLAEYKKIAVINFHHIGDTVCNFSLIKYCRLKSPQAKITVFLGEENGGLAPFITDCDEVVVVPITSKKRRYFSLIKFALRYRKQFDLVICGLEPRKYIHIFMWLLQARTVVAYVGNTWHSKLINHGVLYNDPLQRTCHNALHTLNVVANYRELPEELLPRIIISQTLKQQFLPQILSQLGDKISPPHLLISVTNNREKSTIDLILYRDLFAKLKEQCNFSVVISYLPKDKKRAEELAAILPVPSVPIATPNFAAFLVLLDLIDFCFLGDGGITHLAAALNKPQLVLFGAISPCEWLPLNKQVYYLHDDKHVKYIDQEKIVVTLKNLLTQVQVRR